MHKLAMAVINDGATYEARKTWAIKWMHKTWSDDYVMGLFHDLVCREAKARYYEGEVFAHDEKWDAAQEIFDYMLEHVSGEF